MYTAKYKWNIFIISLLAFDPLLGTSVRVHQQSQKRLGLCQDVSGPQTYSAEKIGIRRHCPAMHRRPSGPRHRQVSQVFLSLSYSFIFVLVVVKLSQLHNDCVHAVEETTRRSRLRPPVQHSTVKSLHLSSATDV